jgi:hypothetical protein
MDMGEWKAGGWDCLVLAGVWLNCCCNGWAAGIGNGNGGTDNWDWLLGMGGRKMNSLVGSVWQSSGGRAAICMQYTPARASPPIAIATPIHAYHIPPPSTTNLPTHGSRTSSGRASASITWRGVTSSPRRPALPLRLCDPWALALRFGLGFAAAPPVAPKLHQTAPNCTLPRLHAARRAGNACPREGYSSASSPSNHRLPS